MKLSYGEYIKIDKHLTKARWNLNKIPVDDWTDNDYKLDTLLESAQEMIEHCVLRHPVRRT